MWDERSEQTEVGRSKGDVGMFWGARCGHRVASEEPKGIPGGPLRAKGAAQGRPRESCHTLAYLLSVQKLSVGVRGGESRSTNRIP